MTMVSKIHVLDAIARLHALMAGCGELRSAEGLVARTKLMEITAAVNRGPVLALPWSATPPPLDGKMAAANDLTLQF